MNPWRRMEVIGNATLYLGDCLTVLPALPKVDAVITDPPYGVGLQYGIHDDNPLGYWEWWKPVSRQLQGVSDQFIFTHRQAAVREHTDWTHLAIWSKPMSFGFSSGGWLPHWEPIFWYGKPGKYAPDVLTHNPEKPNGHPTPKPLSLMVEILSASCAPYILDPFMGSGTTGVACMNLGRRFIGVEIEPKYFDIACERITNAQRQERMFA